MKYKRKKKQEKRDKGTKYRRDKEKTNSKMIDLNQSYQ